MDEKIGPVVLTTAEIERRGKNMKGKRKDESLFMSHRFGGGGGRVCFSPGGAYSGSGGSDGRGGTTTRCYYASYQKGL